MSSGLANSWQLLGPRAPSGERLLARVALPTISERLQCAIDSSGHRHLLIRLTDTEPELVDVQSRGLTVHTRDLVVRGQNPGRYLDIECGDVTGHTIFDVIAADLADELAKPNSQPAETVRRILARWRRFWAHTPLPLLSREEQLGLFAEVWFLDVWLWPQLGAAEALLRWHGPTGARHDFSWSTKAVEAKATTSSRGRIFKINGLDQLVPPQDGSLYLFGMRLQEDTGTSNSLPALIARLRTKLAPEPDSLGKFESLLALAGYSTAYEKEYDKLRLIVRDERLFAVTGDFPKLTPAELPNGLSAAIERVEYEVNLNAFDHLCLAGNDNVRLALA
jgi:hypothetical protein